MDERLLIVFRMSSTEYLKNIQIPEGTLVGFDSNFEELYYGTDRIRCLPQDFIAFTRELSFSALQTIAISKYKELYFKELGVSEVEEENSHDYGNVSYDSVHSTAKNLIDLGIKFKFKKM